MFDQCMKKFLVVAGGGIALLALLAVPAAARRCHRPFATSVQAPPGKVKLPAARSMLDQVRRAGVLRVGVVEQIPWTFTNRSGQLVGFEVDVARALASDLGVRLELVRASSNGIADDVAGGHADIGAAGLWYSPGGRWWSITPGPIPKPRCGSLRAGRRRPGGPTWQPIGWPT